MYGITYQLIVYMLVVLTSSTLNPDILGLETGVYVDG